MAACKTCKKHIEDKKRHYCDEHREYRAGKWRKKGWIKQYFRDNQHKYNIRKHKMTRTGFSEHMRTNRKTGEPLFKEERIAVRKEKRRIGI